MKKLIYVTIVFLILVSTAGAIFATDNNATLQEQKIEKDILTIKTETQRKIEEYTQKYGSESYGLTAYILNTVRIYSIPFCFIGIAIGAICQYAIGTRRLDMKQKGFNLIITFITILVICQVLPLIYMVVVIGWRG